MADYGRRFLRPVFVVTLTWTTVVLFARWIDFILSLNPLPEGLWLHGGVEVFMLLFVFTVVIYMSSSVFRIWPAFLRVQKKVSWRSLALRLILYGPVVFIIIGIVFFMIQWVFVIGSEDPAHSQYGLSAWFAGFFYSIALTPPVTVICGWLSVQKK